jgi:hypothetical protein
MLNPVPLEDAAFVALRTYLLTFLDPEVEVVQGQANRVPSPAADNFVIITATNRQRLATNENTWDETGDDPEVIDRKVSTLAMFQLDLHGPISGDIAQMIATLTRDQYGYERLVPLGFAPLYATDADQLPFITGENQYENRWTMRVALQTNPIVSTPQDFAATVEVEITPIGDANP